MSTINTPAVVSAPKSYTVATDAIAQAVASMELRVAVAGFVKSIPQTGKAGYLTLNKVMIYSGPLAPGNDKLLRAIVNPDGGTSNEVSTARDWTNVAKYGYVTHETPRKVKEVTPTPATPAAATVANDTAKDGAKPSPTVTPQGVKANQPLPDRKQGKGK